MIRKFIFILAILAGLSTELYSAYRPRIGRTTLYGKPTAVTTTRQAPSFQQATEFSQVAPAKKQSSLYERAAAFCTPLFQQPIGTRPFSTTKPQQMWTGGRIEGDRYIPQGDPKYVRRVQLDLTHGDLNPEKWQELLKDPEMHISNKDQIQQYINFGHPYRDSDTGEWEYWNTTPLKRTIKDWSYDLLRITTPELAKDLNTLWYLEYQITDALLRLGADPLLNVTKALEFNKDLKFYEMTDSVGTPLAVAIRANNPGAVKRLLEAGANPFDDISKSSFQNSIKYLDWVIGYYKEKKMEGAKASAELIKRLIEDAQAQASKKADEQEAQEQYETLD